MNIDELSTNYMRLRSALARAYAEPEWDSGYIDSLTDEIADIEVALAASGWSQAVSYPTHEGHGTAVALAYHEEGTHMNHVTSPATPADNEIAATTTTTPGADDWQRRFGVPWDRVERAVRAVSDRAAAASKRKFADLNSGMPMSEAHPG